MDKGIAVSIGSPVTIEGLSISRCYILSVVYGYTSEASVFILGPTGIISTIKDELGDRIIYTIQQRKYKYYICKEMFHAP